MENLKEKTIRSLFWKLIERGGSSVVQLIVQIVMARLLAPEQFGALAIMLIFVNIGNVIVQSGLNTALVQNLDTNEEDYSTVFWLSATISVLLYYITYQTAPILAHYYQMDSIIEPLRILALILIINSYNAVQVAIVQRTLEFKKIFNATIASVLFSGCLGIGMAFYGAGLWALVGQQLSYQVVNCISLTIQVHWRPRFVFNIVRARVLFSFGWKLLVSGLLETGYQSLIDLIVGKQFSTTLLGYMSQGKKYPQALGGMLDGAIQPVMLSAVSQVQDNIVQVKKIVRRALRTSTFLIMPAMALLAIIASPFVEILLGEQWLPCVPFLQAYCFIFALLPIHTSNLQALNGIGRSDLFLKLEIIKKSYGVFLILLAALVFQNIYAVVATYMLCGVINTFVNAFPNKRIIGYSYHEQLKDIAPAVFLSLGSSAITWPIGLLTAPPLFSLVLQIAMMSVVYFALSKLFQIEAFAYLSQTLESIFNLRKSSKDSKRSRK